MRRARRNPELKQINGSFLLDGYVGLKPMSLPALAGKDFFVAWDVTGIEPNDLKSIANDYSGLREGEVAQVWINQTVILGNIEGPVSGLQILNLVYRYAENPTNFMYYDEDDDEIRPIRSSVIVQSALVEAVARNRRSENRKMINISVAFNTLNPKKLTVWG